MFRILLIIVFPLISSAQVRFLSGNERCIATHLTAVSDTANLSQYGNLAAGLGNSLKSFSVFSRLPFVNAELQCNGIEYTQSKAKSALSISYAQLGYHNWKEHILSFAIAKKVASGLNIGVNIYVESLVALNYQTTSNISGEWQAFLKLTRNSTFGIIIKDPIRKKSFEFPSDYFNSIASLRYHISPEISIACAYLTGDDLYNVYALGFNINTLKKCKVAYSFQFNSLSHNISFSFPFDKIQIGIASGCNLTNSITPSFNVQWIW